MTRGGKQKGPAASSSILIDDEAGAVGSTERETNLKTSAAHLSKVNLLQQHYSKEGETRLGKNQRLSYDTSLDAYS